MDEYVHRQYLREEDFLEEYFQTVEIVLPHLGNAWQPNFGCSEQARFHRDRLLAKGELTELTFDSAVFFHNREGLSSIRLYLRSSTRFLVARIHWPAGETQVEILADCVPAPPVRHANAAGASFPE